MKLRVKVDGRSYEVEVEAVEPTWLGSAASRVSGSPVGTTLPKPPPNGTAVRPGADPRPSGAAAATPAATPPPASVPAPLPEPPPARPPWHGLTVGDGGECLAPVPGVVSAVFVKVGDSVKANDPLLELEMSRLFSPQDKPLLGTVRAFAAGVVADVGVQPGQTVAFGQPLVRVRAEEGAA